jgi:hypothetical protein
VRVSRSGVLVVALLGLGCRGYHETAKVASWTNEGRLCVVPSADITLGTRPTPPDDVLLEPDVPLSAVVLFSSCEDCVEDVQASCTVHVTPDLIEVSSNASYGTVREDVCGAGCDAITATCAAGSFTAGTITFEHGGDLLPLELPSTSYPCVGETTAPELVPE